MLKFFYRMKRRKGVVLFAVIAIMTLIIAMASVAYFNARSSYKTVVSNYDFSQTYISATSIADMLIGAASQQSSRSESNDFSNLKSIISEMEVEAFDALIFEAEKEDKEDTPRNITEMYFLRDGETLSLDVVFEGYDDKGNKKTEREDTRLSAADKEKVRKNTIATGSTKTSDGLPVSGGILDSASVNITLDKVVTSPDLKATELEAKYNCNYYFYTFTTTAVYRDNTVTVQDVVYHRSAPESESSELPAFDTFFTATGQVLDGSGDVDLTKSRSVLINTDHISDNAYFQNDDTLITDFDSARTVTMDGGVLTTGNLWVDANIGGTLIKPEGQRRHDWIIGGDLFITEGNSSVDFNGNSLYVKGDMYVSSTTCRLNNFGSVVIEGNLYMVNDTSTTVFNFCNYDALGITGAHRTKQGIFIDSSTHKATTGIDPGIYKTNGTQQVCHYITVPEGETIPAALSDMPSGIEGKWVPEKYAKYIKDDIQTYELTYKDGTYPNVTHHYLTIDGYLSALNAKKKICCLKAGHSDFTVKLVNGSLGNNNTFGGATLYYNAAGFRNDFTSNYTRGGDYEDITAQFSQLFPVTDENGNLTDYKYNMTSIPSSQLLDASNGALKKKTFSIYSANARTMANVLSLDFGKIGDMNGGKTYIIGSLKAKDEKGVERTYYATITCYNNQRAVIDLPYVPDGYILYMMNGVTYTETYQEPDWSSGCYWDPNIPNQWGGMGDTVWNKYITKTREVTVGGYPGDLDNGLLTVRIHTGNMTREEEEGKGVNIEFKDESGNVAYTLENVKNPYEYKTMPIVLAANCFDGNENVNNYGSAKDLNGNNAFSWLMKYDNKNGVSIVELVDEAPLMFITKDEYIDMKDDKGWSDADQEYYIYDEDTGEMTKIEGIDSATHVKNPEFKDYVPKNAEGYVMFEMGNIDINSEPKGYVSFDKSKTLESVVYYASGKQLIGTKAQIEKILTEMGQFSAGDSFDEKIKYDTPNLGGLNGGTSVDAYFESMYEYPDARMTYPMYNNKLILVSNKNGARKAFDASNYSNSTSMCGYIYAPNGSYSACYSNGSHPLFGGMIVSDYVIDQSSYVYCQPDPNLIEGLTKGLEDKTGGIKVEGINEWNIHGAGSNYLG